MIIICLALLGSALGVVLIESILPNRAFYKRYEQWVGRRFFGEVE